MTHNQYIAFFRSFATNHLQINSFANGEKQEYTANQSGQVPTVTMWVVTGDDPIDGNVEKTKYLFAFCDILNKDKSNLDEVLSDTKRIAKDFIATMRRNEYEEYFQIEKQSTLSKFQDEVFDNESAGWEFEITFNSDFDEDTCQIPTTGLPEIIGTVN